MINVCLTSLAQPSLVSIGDGLIDWFAIVICEVTEARPCTWLLMEALVLLEGLRSH
jgi:hypothetical protein